MLLRKYAKHLGVSFEGGAVSWSCRGFKGLGSHAAPFGSSNSNPVSCTDAYSYGCLIHEVYNGPFSRPEQLGQSRERIPQPLFPYYRSLLDPNPSSRLNFAGLMDVGMRPGSFFDTDFIQTANFLETINLKEQSEKERFVTQLVSKIDRFPDSFAKHKVLPELVNALEFGAGGAKMISPILKLGESLPKDDYDRIVLGALVKMFSSPERQMRVALLDNLPKFADRFEGNNNKLVNEKIFPEIAKGFNDTSVSSGLALFDIRSYCLTFPLSMTGRHERIHSQIYACHCAETQRASRQQ